MKIFPLPFSIANEVVKRSQTDNRRLIDSPVVGGNDLFYLGTPTQFIDKFKNPLRQRLTDIRDLCDTKFNNANINPRTLQRGEGILVNHRIKKTLLSSLIPFIEPYLLQFGNLYHNVNFNKNNILQNINRINGDYIKFNSDLVFIHDRSWAKPYFKWFNYPTYSNFKLIQEFFIPHQSFLNFNVDNYTNGELNVTWELSYTISVMYTSDNVEAVVSKAVEQLPLNNNDIETIKEAIVKIRIGQSQFRNDLINSERNNCLFTSIANPDLLIASHIKPWSKSDNRERLDVNNGILLTPTFDKLFDKFLITFSEDGHVIWSENRLDEDTKNKIISAYPDITDISLKINNDNQHYIAYHRTTFLEKEANN